MHSYKITAVFAASHWIVEITEDETRTVWHRSGAVVAGGQNAALDLFCAVQQDAQHMIQVFNKINTKPQFTACYEHEDKLQAMGVEV